MNARDASGPVIIAGGSGFLGLSLAHHLGAGSRRVVLLSRSEPRARGAWTHVKWDARTLEGGWAAALEGASALVNLTGRSVDCVKTPDHVDEIVRSRVESTRVLGRAMRAVGSPPRVWVQMSTAHIYGDPPQVVCDEGSALGLGLAPQVGRAWEEAFREGLLEGQRGVVLRTSFVIGRDRGAGAGAMSRFRTLARLGLAGRIGHGSQGISWIHEEDLNRLFVRGMEEEGMEGVYVASAPSPVSQEEFMRALRRVMGVPVGLPAPGVMVRLGARYLLRTDPELALYGRYVVSRRLREEGFAFRFGDVESALRDVLRG